ncbi:beach-domain-containing protein [Delitschia confertaspora ATCC 74209]|uniref:Beach-domain-containing protein n=1 Tax=Delitschia confertaspora ATCC 74209 TaxID=1513339 RepID=A0A9P4MV21_9PLEO|nr:beach-domain-containing protein [Delitschia confertaspora ATCC 74209]
MEATTRPHRSSTAASQISAPMNSQIAELRSLADELHVVSDVHPLSSETLQNQSNVLRRMRQLLIESHEQTQTKDAFRHVEGFDVLLLTLRSLAGFYNPSKLSSEDRIDFFEVIKATMDVLSESLNEHSGNRRYFAKRVEGGGWSALEQALGSTGIFGGQAGEKQDDAGQGQLLGCLFAFALGEEAMTRIFRNIDSAGTDRGKQNDAEPEARDKSSTPDVVVSSTTSPYATSDIEPSVDLELIRAQLQKLFNGNEVLQNPDVVPVILHFWQMLSRQDVADVWSKSLSVAVLLAIRQIIAISPYNKAALHVTGALSILLSVLSDDNCSVTETGLLRDLADSLMEYGITRLEDAYLLFREASISDKAAEFLLHGMRASRGPPFIQFDLSLHGFSAIELPELGRSFPPTATNGGYTFTAWIRVDKYDPNCHTTIFGVYDSTQTCFVMAYIEKDTRRFILQTSMQQSSGGLPSVRFKKTATFEEGRWYHIAVVHRRAKAMGLGGHKASLYIDGEFTEAMKCQYPASPAVMSSSHESFASISSNSHRQAPIFAFLGTPQNLAPRLGQNVLNSKLSVSSFHLFQEPLSDELIAVHNKLGPRYYGNFQDRLGSFQTYRTSAELYVHNDILHPGREERSDIVSAVRTHAGNLMPEHNILLSFSPASVMDDDDRNNIDESQLIQSLSKEAARTLHRHTRMRGNPIIINGALPSINDALTHRNGYGRLTGDPVVVVPSALDDAIWRIGGCAAVGIKLVQLAQTPEALLRSVKILLEAVEGNWRNCEAMETTNGFAILAEVIRQKFGSSTSNTASRKSSEIDMSPDKRESLLSELLQVLLRFVGYVKENTADSLIINPLAYRVLLVDLDLFRRSTSIETQKLYYSQFISFAKGSKHHHYNVKRFSRIRIVKKLMDALKSEPFTPEAFPFFLDALKVLVEINFSGENSRFLALFVTYALHDSRSFAKRSLRPKASALRLRKGTPPALSPAITPRSSSPANDHSVPSGMPLAELGISILRVLAELLCNKNNTAEIQRFAKNVTNKWLLYLLAEPDQRAVVLGARILARLLVVNGPHYVKKFSEKSGGFLIMKNRLRYWWNTPGIWTICFAILFGRDIATIDFERDFDVFNLIDVFISHSKLRIVYPDVFPVIAAMLDIGLRAIVRDPARPENEQPKAGNGEARTTRGRKRTMSLTQQSLTDPKAPQTERLNDYAAVLNSAIQFLSEVHARSESFKDYAISSNYVQELLFVLYPLIVTSDSVSAETELLSRGSALTFEGQDVVIQPLSKANSQQAPIIRTVSTNLIPPSTHSQRAIPLRRGSSFILISADKSSKNQRTPRLNPILSSRNGGPVALKVGSTVVEAMLEVIMGVFQEQLLRRKEFPGLALFLKTPPGFQEHQAYFESYILRQAISTISNAIQLDKALLHEPRVLINLSRFVTHISEAVFEGWFLNGAEPLLDFAGLLLEYLERPEVARIKSVRLCAQVVGTIRAIFLRVVLLRLSETDDGEDGTETTGVIDKMIYWQPIILSSENTEGLFLRLVCYLLYTRLVSEYRDVRLAAANFWRLLLVQKPDETSAILGHALNTDKKHLYDGFHELVKLDNEAFLLWVDANRTDLNDFFFGTMSKTWEEFVQEQNKKVEDTLRARISRRKERLKQWKSEEDQNDIIWNRHEVQTNHWRSNVHASERLKHQRVIQDQTENSTHIATVWSRLERQLKGPCALFEESPSPKWRLDETEGRDRMRMRTILDVTTGEQNYQPKRKDSDMGGKLKVDTNALPVRRKSSITAAPVDGGRSRAASGQESETQGEDNGSGSDPEEDFEMVDDPNEDQDGFEDKNRKVMRSLQRGDQVQHVCNVSRVVGLEAVEGLLILGKDCLYLMDDYFQRSDGEIVRVWQAPNDERDPYVQIIAGTQAVTNRRILKNQDETTRHWKWSEVISISKRRFLLRDVALEVFFDDGRSYLLTAISKSMRDDLHSRIFPRAPHVNKPELLTNSENSWRLDSLRNPTEVPQTLGSRFASAFSSSSSHQATKKWAKGEMSNFHYLMFINTLAGRSFNDLTQYPVFPWVVADYTSEELDLTDPRSFRDLTKPMGCQNLNREAEFRERFAAFAEMDGTEKAFHYGTHYSTAMIVASYLIRLQPFVASYLLVQGGTFDHADRLFYSIEKAWVSASRDNMTDVRELTPEFFYLPEFLTNINGYNFGLRNSGEKIDDVVLPPWAKGDPTIFIAKQREALESPYVSKNLHHWIDLIFGFKQRGDAAVEATNVFHHLTYQGAIDLDAITDPMQRAANIGIINNFGQTPLQVFPRPHPQREDISSRFRRLDTSVELLVRAPGPLLDSHDRVSSLVHSPKSDRLLCSAAFRHNIPPTYDRYMEWGFTDGSVRFYSSDNRKLLGLFEHLHSGQLTTSLFVDGRTLITAGTDCTIAIWNVVKGEKGTVDLMPVASLFGHKSGVVTLAASRAFAAFLSADAAGRVFLWDLNRTEFVRELDLGVAYRRNPVTVQCAKINSLTGRLVLGVGKRLVVTTLNGRVLGDWDVCEDAGERNGGKGIRTRSTSGENEGEDQICAVACYEGMANEWVERELVFTGHRRGVVKVWHLHPTSSPADGSTWTISLIKRLDHSDPGREDGRNMKGGITCILPCPSVVYTGDEEGRVWEWDFVFRSGGR